MLVSAGCNTITAKPEIDFDRFGFSGLERNDEDCAAEIKAREDVVMEALGDVHQLVFGPENFGSFLDEAQSLVIEARFTGKAN